MLLNLPCNIQPFGQYSQARGEDVDLASCPVDLQARQCPRYGPRRLNYEYCKRVKKIKQQLSAKRA